MRVKADCAKPPQEASRTWVQEGDGCWDQQAVGTWTVGDGSASTTQPGYTVSMTWSVPAQIAGSGGSASLSVMTTGGVAQRICVLQAYTSFQIQGGGDACAQTSASMASASATATLLANGASGTTATVWVSLGDGGNLYYSYVAQASTTPPPVVSPPPVLVPTPSGFDQTVTAAEPPPGGIALITSPSLALAGEVTAPSAVTVDLSGLSVRDHVIAAARHECYVNFTKAVFEAVKSASKTVDETFELHWEDLDHFVNARVAGLTAELAACVAFVDAIEAVYSAQARAGTAQASCGMSTASLSLSGSGSKLRLRSFHVGSASGKHQPLQMSCTSQAGKLTITVATRSKRTPLSSIVGSSLQIGIARSPKDSAGGQLSVTFHHP